MFTCKTSFPPCGCTALAHCNQARTLRITTTKLKKIRILGPKNRDAKCNIWKPKKVPKNGPQVAPSYGNHKEGLILGTIFCVLKVEPFCGPCGPFWGALNSHRKIRDCEKQAQKRGRPQPLKLDKAPPAQAALCFHCVEYAVGNVLCYVA